MAKRSKFEILKIKTNNTALLWKDVHGIAPVEAAKKLDKAMLNWMCELTNTLDIWLSKGISMSEGELILAWANLGAVVESWLKFFYCVYYDDYCKEPIIGYKGKTKEPEEASFDKLKEFSCGKLWNDETSTDYTWVDSVQYKRNAIHSFKYRDIGTAWDFIEDVDYLCDFVDNVISHLPPIEDYIEMYPAGYVINILYSEDDND